MVLGRAKPDGTIYENTDKNWEWLQGDCAKAGRFLGYLPFDQITDQRNAEPVIREFSRPEPYPYMTVGIDVEIPEADEITPRLGVADFRGIQPYHLVMIGEKSSLADVLGPIAQAHDADLYLPTGEPSDTLLYRMAATAAEDGRPMAVLYFSDCDPAGWTMPLSVSRKLQAFKVLLPHMPDFEVHRVALLPDQVREYGLPSSPLKETEKRADRWREAWGVDQTEIDALASLRPDLLRRIARDAVAPFYDYELDRRVQRAADEWTDQAIGIVNDQVDRGAPGRHPRRGGTSPRRHAGPDRRTEQPAAHRRPRLRPARDRHPRVGAERPSAPAAAAARFPVAIRRAVRAPHRIQGI